MTIWRSLRNSAPTGDPAIHVKYTGLSISTEKKDSATEAVVRARSMVSFVVAKLGSLEEMNSSKVVSLRARNYFKLDGPATQAEFDLIKSVLVMIQTGLNSDMNIKVSPVAGKAGYVRRHDAPRKARWTQGTRTHDKAGNPLNASEDVYRGDIHITKEQLKKDIRYQAKNVVHESSHKFASTSDFGERGYTNDQGGAFRKTGLTKDEALNNAESYAQFVLRICLDEGHQ
jgi:hypothetical protein